MGDNSGFFHRHSTENLFFIHIIKCQSINYNSVKFQVERLRNKNITIYLSSLAYKQEGASLRHFDFMLVHWVFSMEIPVACFHSVYSIFDIL